MLQTPMELQSTVTDASSATESEVLVTLVVTPRERFSCAQESLDSIYEHTQFPFKLLYIDGNSPRTVRRYLDTQAQKHHFQLVRTNYYLSPTQARNLSLPYLDTRYVVFIDNDVIVSPGWLQALVSCAEETGAAVVGPLMCQDRPLHQTIHFAGGEGHVYTDVEGRRHLREKMYCHGQPIAKAKGKLHRSEVELVEFHCMLVRTAYLKKVSGFDPGMMNTKEHIDFCMTIAQAGGKLYCEPSSIVTYVPGPPESLADVHYYMLRWSDAWAQASVDRVREKWDLTADRYLDITRWRAQDRRIKLFVDPIHRHLSFGTNARLLYRILRGLERRFNAYLTWQHARSQSKVQNLEQPALKSTVSMQTNH